MVLIHFVFLATLSFAQTPVQVVTKVIEKELTYQEGQPIHLNAQKADLILKGWNRPTVSVRLRLIAKHPDRAIAERELDYHQYTLQAENGQLDLSNRFVIPKQSGKLQSQLKAVYEISLPSKAFVVVSNSFGDIRLSDLAGDVSVKFEFGKLTLDDIAGKLSVTSDYGDVDGRNLSAALTVKAQKADITLRDIGGTVSLQSRYGKLAVFPSTTLTVLKIEAARTEILVSTKRISDFRFDVISSFADIRVPEGLTEQLSKYNDKQVFSYQPASRKPEIAIQNSYSPISIQGEKPLVNR
ncbi:DUF4097 family beta strand repeat-containing protein [Spirosoma sp. KCTC 42546]|uniref:DUF4097 family beta strand repeat-containing protein n=1 Tax=Spirosoma sp. KCTC 42546 TaxID=2520506 RepID=UPI001FEE6E5C|nr:DUF4097 family beta strand repeat-containing protein [Spirosoma sp. KCTC 42546]